MDDIIIPSIFKELYILNRYRYKIYEGGRNGGKSGSFARALLILACRQKLRILCTRETQEKLADSVYHLLLKIIDEKKTYGKGDKHIFDDFTSTLSSIKNIRTGSEFVFAGLRKTEDLKSIDDIDICWVEEAHFLTYSSIDLLTKTIRNGETEAEKKARELRGEELPTDKLINSEIWFSFNRQNDVDPIYGRYCNRPNDKRILHKSVQYYDNPFHIPVMDEERIRDKETLSIEDYNHIWLGHPTSNTEATFYGFYVEQAIKSHRVCRALYNISLEVHTAWDLGISRSAKGDRTAIVFYQIYGNEIRFIDYYDNFNQGMEHYAEILQAKQKEYKYKYGIHFAPHDANNPRWGKEVTTIVDIARSSGIEFIVVPRRYFSDGIQIVKHNFYRCYFESEMCNKLIQCLKQYRRKFNKTTQEYESELHDMHSHGADAFRYAIQSTEHISKVSGREKTEEDYQGEYEDYYMENYSDRDNITGY